MSYAANRKDLDPCLDHGPFPGHNAVAKTAGVLRYTIDAIFRSRQRAADRELAQFSCRSGRSLTDSLEREMMERRSPANWHQRD